MPMLVNDFFFFATAVFVHVTWETLVRAASCTDKCRCSLKLALHLSLTPPLRGNAVTRMVKGELQRVIGIWRCINCTGGSIMKGFQENIMHLFTSVFGSNDGNIWGRDVTGVNPPYPKVSWEASGRAFSCSRPSYVPSLPLSLCEKEAFLRLSCFFEAARINFRRVPRGPRGLDRLCIFTQISALVG